MEQISNMMNLDIQETATLALSRAIIYLKAAGFSSEEAGKTATVILAESGDNEQKFSLEGYMGQIMAASAQRLPKAQKRPLRLGHMLAADFQKSVDQPAGKK